MTPPRPAPTPRDAQVAKFLEARVVGIDQGEEHWCRDPPSLRLLLETLLLAVRHNGTLRSTAPVPPAKREGSPEAQVAALLTRHAAEAAPLQPLVQAVSQEQAGQQVCVGRWCMRWRCVCV